MNTLIIFGAKYLFLVGLAFFVVYFFRLPKEQRKTAFIFSLIDLPAVYLASLIAGYFYNNPRPFVSEHITPLISHAADNGFPSDHTLLVAALASILYYYNRALGFIVFGVALLIGVSRVFAGIHHWIDLIGSFAIAIVVTAIVYQLSKKRLFV
jgi:undecaprenyl-diphosphatase